MFGERAEEWWRFPWVEVREEWLLILHAGIGWIVSSGGDLIEDLGVLIV